jgi:hypothetical protein
MMAEFTRAPEFKAALIAAAHTLWDTDEPDVQIARGHPGKTQRDDIVAFGKVTSQQEPGPLGPRRARNETVTVAVVFSIYRRGGPDQEQVAEDRAYKLLGDLENYVRKTDTTLGGTVLHCFLSEVESDGASEPNIIASGRLIEVTGVFQAFARIITN